MIWKIIGNPRDVTPNDADGLHWRYKIRLGKETRECVVVIPETLLESTPVPAGARSKGRPALMDALRKAEGGKPPTRLYVRADGYKFETD